MSCELWIAFCCLLFDSCSCLFGVVVCCGLLLRMFFFVDCWSFVVDSCLLLFVVGRLLFGLCCLWVVGV